MTQQAEQTPEQGEEDVATETEERPAVIDVESKEVVTETSDAEPAPEQVAVPAPTEIPGTEVEAQTDADRAVNVMADQAFTARDAPGIARRDEFLAIAAQARMLSMSGAAPKAIRNHPYIAFHVAMVCRDLDISITAGAHQIDVIGDPDKNENVSLALSPELLMGLVERRGLGKVVPLVKTRERCVAVALRPGGYIEWDVNGGVVAIHGEIGRHEFTWEDAQDAELAGRACKPGDHKKNDQGKCPCKDNYKKYPRRMLWWRAGGFCVDDNFPAVGLGLYSAEEQGAFVDEEGHPIDPTQAALPEGYEVGRGDSRPLAPQEMRDTLKRRVNALPGPSRLWVKERMAQHRITDAEGKALNIDLLAHNEAGFVLGWIGEAEKALKGSKPEVAQTASESQERPDPTEGTDEAATAGSSPEAPQGQAEADADGKAADPDSIAAIMERDGITEPEAIERYRLESGPVPDMADVAGEPGPAAPGPQAAAEPGKGGAEAPSEPGTPVAGTPVVAATNDKDELAHKLAEKQVTAMTPSQVNARLRERGQFTEGPLSERRTRLVGAIALELMEDPEDEEA